MVSDDDIVNMIQKHLHVVLTNAGFAWDQVWGIRVGRMGSREYITSADEVSLHEIGSDLDLYITGCTDEMVHRSNDLLRALGCRLLKQGVTLREKRFKPTVIEHTHTLKWTTVFKGRNVDTSVLLADAGCVRGARNATRCAAFLLASKPEWRSAIRELLTELRAMGLLSPHGRDAKVGQHLKTVSFTLLRCGILSSSGWEVPTTSTMRAQLLTSIARFDASESVVKTHWPGTGKKQCAISVENRYGRSSDALMILVNGRNSANRLTQPPWFALQHACGQKASLPNLCNIIKLPTTDVPNLPQFESSHIQHTRFLVPDAADPRKDEYVVLTLTPCQNDGDDNANLLIVLTGTGNKTSCESVTDEHVQGYKEILYITWRSGWQSVPKWLPCVLTNVLLSWDIWRSDGWQAVVLAQSRGVQAFLYACTDPQFVEQSTIIDRTILAGGCLWERGTPDILQKIRSGLTVMAQKRATKGVEAGSTSRPKPLSVVIVSEGDQSVSKRGAVSKTGSKKITDWIIGI